MHRDLAANPVAECNSSRAKRQRRHCHPHARPALGESCLGATSECTGIWHGSDCAQGAQLSGERWYQWLCGWVTALHGAPGLGL